MTRTQLVELLDEIRALREQVLMELAQVREGDFATPTPMARWDDARRILLRFGDHMREHASHLEGIRAELDRSPSPPMRMLAEAEVAWGKLLAATMGLTDPDLDTLPTEGGWSVRQLLAHVRESELNYLNALRAAGVARSPEDG